MPKSFAGPTILSTSCRRKYEKLQAAEKGLMAHRIKIADAEVVFEATHQVPKHKFDSSTATRVHEGRTPLTSIMNYQTRYRNIFLRLMSLNPLGWQRMVHRTSKVTGPNTLLTTSQ